MFVAMVYVIRKFFRKLIQIGIQALCSDCNKESIFMTGICGCCSANDPMSYDTPVCASNCAHCGIAVLFSWGNYIFKMSDNFHQPVN